MIRSAAARTRAPSAAPPVRSIRTVGPATDTPAIASRNSLKIGAAMQRIPSVRSPSSTAQPRARIAASSSAQPAAVGDRRGGEGREPLLAHDPRDRLGRMVGEQRLADARGVDRPARPRPEERPDRLVRLDLGDEHHLPAVGDREVRGLAGLGHQRVHDAARLLDEAGAPEEGAADAERLLPDEPELASPDRPRPRRAPRRSRAPGRPSPAPAPRPRRARSATCPRRRPAPSGSPPPGRAPGSSSAPGSG